MGADWNVRGAVGIEMLKFEAKKGDFYMCRKFNLLYKMYVTLKLDDNGCCRIYSVSDDGNGWIVTNEKYVVMPWKMVTGHGINMGPLRGHDPRRSS